MTSRAEKVFKEGLPLNRRGEHNVARKYLKAALYITEGDETGYFVYHKGLCVPIEFDFTHCFWFIVKYKNQRSCWKSYKLPTKDYNLDILDSKVTDQCEWGPIDNDNSDKSKEEDHKSTSQPESIDIKIPSKEEEKSERQLEKLAESIPVLTRPRSNTATSRLPPITTVMATQTMTEPMQTIATQEGTSSV